MSRSAKKKTLFVNRLLCRLANLEIGGEGGLGHVRLEVSASDFFFADTGTRTHRHLDMTSRIYLTSHT